LATLNLKGIYAVKVMRNLMFMIHHVKFLAVAIDTPVDLKIWKLIHTPQ